MKQQHTYVKLFGKIFMLCMVCGMAFLCMLPAREWDNPYQLIIDVIIYVVVSIMGALLVVTILRYRNNISVYKKNETEYSQILSAMGDTYGSIYICSVKRNTSKIVKYHKLVDTVKLIKRYSDAIRIFADNYLHEEDRELFKEKMSLENIKSTLNPANRSISLECRHIKVKGYQWIRVVASLTNICENGEVDSFILAIQDIDDAKSKELALREETVKALREASDAANNANREKTVFLSKMSHDMRTPMNAIAGMTAIAAMDIDNKEKVKECLSKINMASEHLLSLINEVLDMSRIESGHIDLAHEEINIRTLVSNVITMVSSQIDTNKKKITVDLKRIVNDDVFGDGMRLQQVLMNLVVNAVKYTPEGGQISISAIEKEGKDNRIGCYEFIIEDNGIGMSEEFAKKVFEPFARADDKRVADIPGTGLGMAIAKNIVCMMDGDIVVDSTLNKGTKVFVTVYLEQRLAEEDISDEETDIEELMKESNFKGKRALVAEDNDFNREIAIELLKMMEITADGAENGEEAVKMVEDSEEGYYDIIFLDIQMPVMDGCEAAGRIRSMNRTDAATVPLIAVSANAFAQDVQESYNAGINEHLAKPIDIRKLYRIMARYLK